MQAPWLADDSFLADVAAARTEPHKLHIWWMGQSGFLLLWQSNALFFDPYLSDSLTKKYRATDKPHVRMTGRVIAPDRLDFVQAATSTHMHTDHLDGETLHALWRANPAMQLLVPAANQAEVAARLEIPAHRLVPLDTGIHRQVGVFGCTAVPAAHETLEVDALGRHKYVGYIVQVGPWMLYHSGDTVLYPDMVAILRGFAIDMALLPINGRKAERRVAGNLTGAEAARLARDIGAGLVIPCHFDMFAFNSEPPDDFVAACESLGQPYCVLHNGERWSGAK